MLTDTDINKLKAVFATKEDLMSFATKDDLKKFATKDDIKFLSERIDNLADTLQKSNEDLVELISTGFKLNEDRFKKIEQKLFTAN